MRLIVEARVEEILEYADKELKKIHRSRKLPGGIVLTGGTAHLPGLVDFTKEVMELPARIGNYKHIKRVVDGIDEQEFAPAVGLMLLDMFLGPAAEISYIDSNGGMFKGVNMSLNTILGRFKKRPKS
jgi:cell division ATPase FtsA